MDTELATTAQDLLGDKHPVFAVATVSAEEIRTATVGAEPDADFEIGSISKGVTGLLYADALSRDEIGPGTTLGELLPIGDAPAARVTLASLSTHRSGLPRLPNSGQPLRRTIALWRHGTNPYGESLDELIEQARTVKVGKPKPSYSNFGYELLGHALAQAAGTTYRDLVRERIAAPLGLEVFYAPDNPEQLRPEALRGRNRSGRVQQPWTGEALAPAGGLRATIGSMARLTQAMLDGSAPGLAALDPVARLTGPAVRIGAAWITLDHQGHTITWHNGGTGGFRTWLGMDRAAGTGAVVLSASSITVDRHGFALLHPPS